MENTDKTEKQPETAGTLYETLRYVMMAFEEAAGGFIEQDSHTVADMLEDYADASLEEKLEEYDGIWGGLENDVNETLSEIADSYNSWIADKQEEIVRLFDDPFLKEKIVQGIAIIELIVEDAKEAMDAFYELSGYPGVPVYLYKDGQFITENNRPGTPMTLEQYENAFYYIDFLFKQYERSGYAYDLRKLSAELRVCMDLSAYFKLHRSSETIAPKETNETLLHFMKIYHSRPIENQNMRVLLK